MESSFEHSLIVTAFSGCQLKHHPKKSFLSGSLSYEKPTVWGSKWQTSLAGILLGSRAQVDGVPRPCFVLGPVVLQRLTCRVKEETEAGKQGNGLGWVAWVGGWGWVGWGWVGKPAGNRSGNSPFLEPKIRPNSFKLVGKLNPSSSRMKSVNVPARQMGGYQENCEGVKTRLHS